MSEFDYNQLFEQPPYIQKIVIESFGKHAPGLDILRLDSVHKILSGNKVFKLRDYLRECIQSGHKTLLTFGGAFSNHLSATAYATKVLSLKSIGLVRGELMNNSTMRFCREMGMELHPVKRNLFRKISELTDNNTLLKEYGDHTLVPMGGYGIKGAMGASDIMRYIPENTYTHICVSVGSATTLAGLMQANRKEKIMAFPAIKNMRDIPERLLAMSVRDQRNLEVISDYHFGGFAKWDYFLTDFMNDFYRKYRIPLDIAYTSKMMFGVFDLISKNRFSPDSNILCIHTGGLQGNQSLSKGILNY